MQCPGVVERRWCHWVSSPGTRALPVCSVPCPPPVQRATPEKSGKYRATRCNATATIRHDTGIFLIRTGVGLIKAAVINIRDKQGD